MNTKSDAAQPTTPAPVTVERLRELREWLAEYRRSSFYDSFTECVTAIDELLAARETIARIQAAHAVTERDACRKAEEIESLRSQLSRSPAVKQATACGDTEGLVDELIAAVGECELAVDDGPQQEVDALRAKIIAALTAESTLTTPVAEAVTQPIAEQGKAAWIPVSKRMPPQRTTILVATEHGVTSAYVCRNGHFHDDAEDDIQGVTHWQPLPAAPSSCTGEGKT